MSDEIKKYDLIDTGEEHYGTEKAFRIKALRDFGAIKKGDTGGFVQSEDNLSHSGNCWIFDDAYVVDNAKVYEDATIRGNSWVFDSAEVYGKASVIDNARIYQNAKVYGHASIQNNALIYNSAQVFGNALVRGNSRLRWNMKASKPVTEIDTNDVIITVADESFHVYQSKIYKNDNYPSKYKKLLTFLESIKE